MEDLTTNGNRHLPEAEGLEGKETGEPILKECKHSLHKTGEKETI